MSKFSKKTIRALVALALCAVILAGMGMSALASSTINPEQTGTLTIKPTYNTSPVAGGVFSIYYVATLDNSTQLSFTLTGAFAGATGLDINAVKKAADVAPAVALLRPHIVNVPSTDVITLDRNAPLPPGMTEDARDTLTDLELGVYLVVQQSAPGRYISAAPFLVFIPTTDTGGASWVYAITANPKLGYDNGGGDDDRDDDSALDDDDDDIIIPPTPVPGGPTPPVDPVITIPPTPIPGSDAPRTGDESNIALWATLLATGMIALCGVVFFGTRKQKEND